MYKVAFASGKGGAGKTTIALSLYNEISSQATLIDCDVDASNCFILLEDKNQTKYPFVSGFGYEIMADLCTNCGACSKACEYGAISSSTSSHSINGFLCEGCGACIDVCQYKAINEEENYCGDIYSSLTAMGDVFYYARLKPGEDNSGKLIMELKKTAFQGENKGLFIIDCPPGIGCPVISALTGINLLVIVIEATRGGYADARNLISLSEGKKYKRVAVLNKSGVHLELEKKIISELESDNIPVIVEIPFDEKIFDILKEKKIVNKTDNEYFNNIIEKLQGVINDNSNTNK